MIDVNKTYPYNLLKRIYDSSNVQQLDDDQLKGLNYIISTMDKIDRQLINMKYVKCLTGEIIAKELNMSKHKIHYNTLLIIDYLRSKKQYFEQGYRIASGELDRQYKQRINEYSKELKLEYNKMRNQLFNTFKTTGKSELLDKELKRISINDLNFDSKVYNILRSLRILNLYDLCNMTRYELSKARGVGENTLNIILDKVHSLKLVLKDELSDDGVNVPIYRFELVPLNFGKIVEDKRFIKDSYLIWTETFHIGPIYMKLQLMRDSSTHNQFTRYKVIVDTNYPISFADNFGHYEKDGFTSLDKAKQHLNNIYNNNFADWIQMMESDIKKIVVY